MLKYINKIFSLKKFLEANVLLDNNTRNYIEFNKKKWKILDDNSRSKKKKKVVLVDLFPWFPWIHFWGYIVNFLIKKFNVEVKFFYFDLYQGTGSNYKFYIRKLIKIYSSLNISKGLTEYDIEKNSIKEIKQKKIFKKIASSKAKIVSYKKDNIIIGDLIYDTYLKSTLKPTVDLKDPLLEKIFIRAENIFDHIKKYFKKNNVFCIIPSHVCYISYGIISRIAAANKIPIFKIHSEFRGNSLHRLTKISSRYILDEPPYWDYKKIFNKLPKKQKLKNLKIGKQILENRLSGKFDRNLPYMPISQFKKKKSILKKKTTKQSIIIFSHCYFDNPHRFRNMIFSDFYEQVLYFFKLSKKLKNYEWYYKPHPNELKGDLDLHKKLMKQFKNVNYLHKSVGHYEILSLNPKCIITNHGTIGHEYAALKVPVLNTGDNPHINYDFNLHAKSITHLNRIMNNLDKYTKKINFDKKQLFEYFYLRYEYFQDTIHDEHIYLKDKYFSTKDIKINGSTKIFDYYIKNKNKYDFKINQYLENFFKKNI
ncbi:hypothetical protein [Candidatus Pelagibacter sp.]|uniref:hypothetical protein n=1 Tax=Candidatus Pelagibacter sp. TaxID=2024849 RepID=UPI003F871DC2